MRARKYIRRGGLHVLVKKTRKGSKGGKGKRVKRHLHRVQRTYCENLRGNIFNVRTCTAAHEIAKRLERSDFIIFVVAGIPFCLALAVTALTLLYFRSLPCKLTSRALHPLRCRKNPVSQCIKFTALSFFIQSFTRGTFHCKIFIFKLCTCNYPTQSW